jgi:hypothetical protein
VKFSNGVLANTYKGFALEILMTMAHILDEGVSSSHSVWRELNMWIPMSIFGNYSVFKGSPGTSVCAWRHIGRFFECDRGRSPSTNK